MNEKRLRKRLEFQEKIISNKSELIESLNKQIEALKLESRAKDELIESVDYLRKELTDNINKVKQKKKEYDVLIQELKNMKKILDKEVYRGRWKFIKFLIK